MEYIEPTRLHAEIDRLRGRLSWRQVANRIGCSVSALVRMKDGGAPNAKTYCAILTWLISVGLRISPCLHERVYWVGGIGTIGEPPNSVCICTGCGRVIS